MVFPIEKVIKIWNLLHCNPNAIYCFACSIMCDLKNKLLIMNLNEILSCIRNLEGTIDLENCIYYSGILI